MYSYRVFQTRSLQPERIDIGDYTAAEYDRFLKEISIVNRFVGDKRALEHTLLKEIEELDLREFSVLDVGAGSGELLRTIAKFAAQTKRVAHLIGLELNEQSLNAMQKESEEFPGIIPIRGDALRLPFQDRAFDYAICSLFTHHFTDESIIKILREFSRVSRKEFFVIDLHRHPMGYLAYKIFCIAFRISPLVRHDGSLSILKSFKKGELERLAEKAGIQNTKVIRSFPFRLVLRGK